MTQPIPFSSAQQIVEKINKLQEMLFVASPGYESLLHEIHVALHKDEEAVQFLTEEQIGIIVAGLSKKKNIVIAQPEKKKNTTSSGKKLKEVSLDDL